MVRAFKNIVGRESLRGPICDAINKAFKIHHESIIDTVWTFWRTLADGLTLKNWSDV